ncbi:MAG TPA: VCBS repeat-containing protein [Thermomicrobiales bacterium]|jgi:hypothetical protein|nr:VCBS repeat-containing protein [Thermomicrobiales bacterium]
MSQRPASRPGVARVGFFVLAFLVLQHAPAAATQTPTVEPRFTDATSSLLVGQPDEPKFSMAAMAADLDDDGDLDLVIASEYAPNRILINDGSGGLTDESDTRLPRIVGDHEDIAIADFDRDGDLDLVFVGEDDQVNGYHRNDGSGVFDDSTDMLPARATSNAVVAVDIDDDGDHDLIIGNNGQDFVFVNDGQGGFSDETAERYPASDDVTQDIGTGDFDRDGDIDLVLGNEDGNRLLFNDGTGRFADETDGRLPANAEETRQAVVADVDEDGDLDLYFANVALFAEGVDAQDRLLLNDGTGSFTDVTASHLPTDDENTFSGAFIDVDRDGDQDLVTGSTTDLSGESATNPIRVLENDGTGRFAPVDGVVAADVTANTFDVEVADFDRDGQPDLFVASRGQTDRLLLAGPAR